MSSQTLQSGTHKARLPHKCEWCAEGIMKGETYHKTTYTYENKLGTVKMHLECQAAFQAEFQYFPPGSLLGFEPHANDRGQPAKEDTLWEV
jgi:hypothetical protein